MGVIAEEAVRIRADTSGFRSEVTSGVMGAVSRVAAAAGGLLAAEKIGGFVKDAVSGAADLEKQQRRVNQVFGESAGPILKFGDSAAKSYGLSALKADTMNASLGQVLKSTGLGSKASADMSEHIVKLSADLGSFTGKDPSRVFTALQKGTLGATRGLKEYGINISQADVKNQALADGIVKPIKNTLDLQNAQIRIKATTEALALAIDKHGKNSQEAARATLAHNNAEVQLKKAMDGTVPTLTTLQKEQASYELIMKAGSIAAGDFGKHSHDLGNEQKILSAQISNVSDSIGKVALPAITAFLAVLIDDVPKAVNAAKAAFDALRGAVAPVVDFIKNLFDLIRSDMPAVEAFAAVIIAAAAAWIAYQAAMLIAAAALKVVTIAELALNAVMDANPVMLVVLAIAALAAGLVILYQRSALAREIMDAAWAGIKAGAQAALDFITNTLIPAAIAAWNRFGPAVVSALNTAASAIRTVIGVIATIVTTVVDQIQAHWKQVWDAIAPVVTAAFNIVKIQVQTTLNVIAGIVRLFAALLRGDWSGAWHALEGIVSDVLGAVKGTVQQVLNALAGTAGRLAEAVGQAIANGIKTAAKDLEGLAGDLVGKIRAAGSQAAGEAFNAMRQVGFSIADGVISGVGNLTSRLVSTVGGMAKGAVGGIIGAISGGSPSRLYADTVGDSIGTGITMGAERALKQLPAVVTPALRTGIAQISAEVQSATAKEGPAIASAFKKWAADAKTAFDNEVAGVETGLKNQLDKATAAINAWKAKLTPAEIQLNATHALEQAQQLQGALDSAWDALKALPAKQAQAMTELMAAQKQVMDGLKATLQSSTDDALVAGARFQNQSAAAAGDPLAAMLIGAQKTFDATKAAFDAGTATQQQFVDASNALDAAKVTASEDSNATQLLDQYNTWQTALAQQAAAGGAITTQQAADNAAQLALTNQQAADTQAAVATKDAALNALLDANLASQAAKERAARDAEATALNAHLVARFDRIKTHLDNVRDLTDAHFAEMSRHANDGGKNLIDALSNGIRAAMPTLQGALTAIANEIKAYLKVSSPTEKGPMSDLDKWWTRMGPTLVASFDTSGMKAALADATTPSGGGAGGFYYPRSGGNGMTPGEAMIGDWLEKIWKQGGGGGKTTGTPPAAAPFEVHVAGGIGIDASVYRARR